MGQIIRCPLVSTPCMKEIVVQEKTFFLAEAENPEGDRKRRIQAINESIGGNYEIRSALDEKGINAFSCKICEMIQTCAYGIADISKENPNVLLELGMMIALGKPTIILLKREQDEELKLFSDLKAIEVIPFTEYIDMIDQLRAIAPKLPPPLTSASPIEDIQKMKPQIAEQLRRIGADIVKEFKESIEEAKLDTISVSEEKIAMPPELSERLIRLEEKLEDLRGLGFVTDPQTAFLRGNYYYNQGKYEKTLADYNHSLKLRPDDPVTLNNRGSTYDDIERYEEALADFNRSLQLRPDNPGTLYNRGTTYIHLKRYEEALADFNRSLEFRPDNPATLYNLACLFSLWEKPDDAITYLEKAIKGDEKYREMAKTDNDFDNIREDPRFKKLIESD
ncbi:tetratricopeptide repeat protein [Chloroflexota bacterium]